MSISTMPFLISQVSAYADNPYVGQPEGMVRQDKAFRSAGSPYSTAVDYSATSLIGNSEANRVDPSSNRFGDGSPSNLSR